MAKVSVVIPTHDRAELLTSRAIPSVLAQDTDLEMEILVVGDATDDETVVDMLAWMADDPRIQFWNLPKQKLPEDPGEAWCVLGLEARNWGYDHATGDFLAGLDDDDALLPHMIRTLHESLVRLGVDVAYGRSTAFGENGRVVGHYGNWPPMHYAFCEGAWLARHDLGYRLDPECISRGLPEDGDKIDRMVAGGVKFAFVDEVIHHYWPNPR